VIADRTKRRMRFSCALDTNRPRARINAQNTRAGSALQRLGAASRP